MARSRAKRDAVLDRTKVTAALQGLSRDALLDLLEGALSDVPDDRLEALTRGALDPAVFAPDGRLLADVRAFDADSRGGDHYEDFNVNSKNWTEQSRGTRRWIAECERLFERCVREAARTEPAELRRAFELLADLLRKLDEGDDDIVFFADEGGSWQVGVPWKDVLPAWFRCLAATATPEDYAREARRVIEDFVAHDGPKFLAKARTAASPAQRKALAGPTGASSARVRGGRL